MYEQDFKPASHRLYPDVVETLEAVRALGVRTALLSNIHFDLRPELKDQGILDLFDSVVLSYEHGIQKPDPKLFRMALDELGVEPTDALMVGDSPTNDGGGVELGVTTSSCPQKEFGPRRSRHRCRLASWVGRRRLICETAPGIGSTPFPEKRSDDVDR